MSHIPNRAMRHAVSHAADDGTATAPSPAPLRAGQWAALGGIAALAGLGVAGLGTALADRLSRRG